MNVKSQSEINYVLHKADDNQMIANVKQYKTSRLVFIGFYGPIAPPVPNARSSQICGQTIHRRHRRKKWWTRIL